MPVISRFFGIIILMYFDDHMPTHFHVRYAEHSARITIDTLELFDGFLPRRALSLVLEWAVIHRDELRENWVLAQNGMPLIKIAPLD
jgi:hypothetical protein